MGECRQQKDSDSAAISFTAAASRPMSQRKIQAAYQCSRRVYVMCVNDNVVVLADEDGHLNPTLMVIPLTNFNDERSSQLVDPANEATFTTPWDEFGYVFFVGDRTLCQLSYDFGVTPTQLTVQRITADDIHFRITKIDIINIAGMLGDWGPIGLPYLMKAKADSTDRQKLLILARRRTRPTSAAENPQQDPGLLTSHTPEISFPDGTIPIIAISQGGAGESSSQGGPDEALGNPFHDEDAPKSGWRALHSATLTISVSNEEISDFRPEKSVTTAVRKLRKSPLLWRKHFGAIYLDTGNDMMCWKKYKSPNHPIEIHGRRWVQVLDGPAPRRLPGGGEQRFPGRLSIFDAAERSNVPMATIAVQNTERGYFSMATSSSGRHNILFIDNRLYKFKAPTYVQPLEMIAAVTTWKQLPKEKRKVLNADGPYNFGTFVHACYDVKNA